MAKSSCSGDVNAGSGSANTSGGSRISMKQSNTFPFRLHEMLDMVAKEGTEAIVSWCPGSQATAFKVHKPAEFVKTIMPRFFQQTKYKSFQRQCNLWGFERLLHGPEKGGYEHPDGFFVRGNPCLINKMVRRKIKRRPLDPEASAPTPLMASDSNTVMASRMASQRRPSHVSLGSHTSGGSVSDAITVTTATGQPGSMYHAEPPSTLGFSPNPITPMVSTYYGSSVENSPSDIPEGLYLPPPSSSQDQNITSADDSADAGDKLFLEGLSAFFEDDSQEISASVEHAVSQPLLEQQDAQAMGPVPQYQQQQLQHPLPQGYQRLQPKRRLSMELFVASRQQHNSNEMTLDLLSDSDTLQRSLEMELMCTVAQPAV